MKHILIDFENIQPASLDSLTDPENTQIWLFLGVHQQKTLPYPLTKSLFRFASQDVHFVEMQRTGKNALDYYLAFYLGKILQMDNNAQVAILARDGGYDILVEHLNATHTDLHIQRFSDLHYLQHLQLIEQEQPPTVLDVPMLVAPQAENPATSEYATLMTTAYKQVFAELKKRLDSQNFIPTKKNNFLSALQKYFLADLLKDWDNDEQFLFAQKLFTRLINYGLIRLKEDGNTLIYQFSDNHLRENVAKFVLISKPKTLEKLTNVLKSHMTLLQMPTDEHTLAKIIVWLKNKTYIYQQDNKISYQLPTTMPQETLKVDATIQELVDKAIGLLTGKFANNRPPSDLL